MSLISVIVPVYNVEQYLCRCVDSILAQTFTDFELILVDDGSPDGCPAICDEYAKMDDRVVVLHQVNRGISGARNAGIQWVDNNSESEWITFVDSDDAIHPQMLELLYKAVDDESADISVCSVLELSRIPEDWEEKVFPKITHQQIDEACIWNLYKYGKQKYWTAWAKLVRREFAVRMPFEEGRIFEDNNLIFKWLCEANRIADVNVPLYFYYVNEHGISKSQFHIKHLDFLHALDTQVQYYKKIGFLRLYRELCIQYLMSSAHMYHKVRKMLNDVAAAKKIKSDIRRFCLTHLINIRPSKMHIYTILEVLHPHLIGVYWRIKWFLK